MDAIISKLLQWGVSLGVGLLMAVETSIPFFTPCLILTILDVISAWDLGRRVHKKHPDRADGKFKSEYKYRILKTMILVFVCLILASHVDQLMLRDTEADYAIRFVMWVFSFYQVWSILENWSSENHNKLARALQRIMVNKAERHLNVPLHDIFEVEPSKKEENNENDS